MNLVLCVTNQKTVFLVFEEPIFGLSVNFLKCKANIGHILGKGKREKKSTVKKW